MISHRPSTIASCDDGIVLDAGRVVEAGPLRELRFYQQMMRASVEQAASTSPRDTTELPTGPAEAVLSTLATKST